MISPAISLHHPSQRKASPRGNPARAWSKTVPTELLQVRERRFRQRAADVSLSSYLADNRSFERVNASESRGNRE